MPHPNVPKELNDRQKAGLKLFLERSPGAGYERVAMLLGFSLPRTRNNRIAQSNPHRLRFVDLLKRLEAEGLLKLEIINSSNDKRLSPSDGETILVYPPNWEKPTLFEVDYINPVETRRAI